MYAIKPWKSTETSSQGSIKSINTDFIVKRTSSLELDNNQQSPTTAGDQLPRDISTNNKTDLKSADTVGNKEAKNEVPRKSLTIEAKFEKSVTIETIGHSNSTATFSEVDGLVDKTGMKSGSGESGTSSDSPGQGGGSGRGFSAKAKRKLREKRRSTGVARFTEIFGETEEDKETQINTSINESIQEEEDTDISAGNAVVSKTSDDLINSVTSPSSTTTTKSCFKRPPPPVSQKPISLKHPGPPASNSGGSLNASRQVDTVVCEGGDQDQEQKSLDLNSSATVKDEERNENTRRVEELERTVELLQKRLADEEAKNTELNDLLTSKNSRINELLQEVDALNQDLDLADEEYEKLEAENRAILKTISALHGK